MKKHIVTLAVFALTFCSITNKDLKAQTSSLVKKTSYSIETDPSTFAFSGYAIHLRINPEFSSAWVFGAGTYALDYPDLLVDMNSDNKNKDWKIRISSAYSFFTEYYFDKANSKWFAGLQVGVQNFKISNSQYNSLESNYSNLIIMPSIGYTWNPFSEVPIYIKPWAGLGYTAKISGENSIERLTYQIAPLVPFMTVHIGYTF